MSFTIFACQQSPQGTTYFLIRLPVHAQLDSAPARSWRLALLLVPCGMPLVRCCSPSFGFSYSLCFIVQSSVSTTGPEIKLTCQLKTNQPGWCGSVIECQPANQKVAGWIASQGTAWVACPGPQVEVCKRQLVDVSLAH